MKNYIEIIDEEYQKIDLATRKIIVSHDQTIQIRKRVSNDQIKYFLPLNNSDNYYNLIEKFCVITGLNIPKIEIYEEEDELSNNNYKCQTKNANGDLIELKTYGFGQNIIIEILTQPENTERYYDNIIIYTLEQTLRQGRQR